jgi:acyl-CoA dehydrogenase
MLMQSLSVGRSISLPSVAAAGTKLSARVASAYAMVREQFDTPIGRFEGVEEPLARIAGLTYAVDAARSNALAAVDAGEKPAVLSAIVKTYCTEAMRDVVNDAMDIRAGAAIMRGPRNILHRIYETIPIGITVEGANILTRSMIIYGQGAIRCHPFALEEMRAVEEDDLARFDRAFFGHVGFVTVSAARSFLLGVSRGALATEVPPMALRRHGQRLARASASFALLSDLAMVTLGGELKRREAITGRLADALAWLYIGSATLDRFARDGEPEGDRPFAQWALERALAEIDTALAGVLRNLPSRAAAWAVAPLVFPFGRSERGPDDALGALVAKTLLDDPDARDRLTDGIFLPRADEPGLGRLEAALRDSREALAVEATLRDAVRAGRLDPAPGTALAVAARRAGILTDRDLDVLRDAETTRAEAIRVDSFDAKEYRSEGLGGAEDQPDA